MSDFLASLNPEQRQAAEHIEGPALIIAGPGSGKTRVLTFRIANLIQHGIDPFNILALTFTNKASKEMRSRIEKLVGAEARNLYMGTFHSVFARLLRRDGPKLGYPSNFTIYDADDAKGMIKTIVKEMNLDEKLYKPNIVYNRISAAKNNLTTPEQYLNNPEWMSEDRSSGRPLLGEIYNTYSKRCFRAGAMDFDDLLFQFYFLLVRFPDALYTYQHLFKFILIDEFQDTNKAQYEIVRKLSDVYQNIVVVGDDAQSIYAFRGATIENIINFERDYPELKVYKLEQNYRSSQNIVQAANHLIKHNRNQLKKTIWTQNNEGEKIKIFKAASDNEEGRIVADTIFENKMRDHLNNSDFAILYRTNAQSRSFEESLRRLNLSYVIYGGVSFYQRKEIKDLIAYLRLAVNPKDEESFRRVLNYPARGIGKSSLDKLAVMANEQNLSLWDVALNIYNAPLPAKAKSAIASFATMIQSFGTMLATKNAYDVAAHIAKSSTLMHELSIDKTPEGRSRFENVEELLNGIKEFTVDDEVLENVEANTDRGLAAYLQNITLLTDTDRQDDSLDTIKLMTIHAAKGLEFPCVFLVGLEENLFPSQMSVYSRDNLEEERRLFYVAVTRAETKLYLSFASTRFKYGNLQYCEPSRFLDEIPKEVTEYYGPQRQAPKVESKPKTSISSPDKIQLSKQLTSIRQAISKPSQSGPFEASNLSEIKSGVRVEHERFGQGKVLLIETNGAERMATIFFDEAGQKKLLLKFARLKILDDSTINS